MRKVLFFLSIVLLTVGMSSCGKGYDLNKCKEFQERIEAGVTFTDDEYAEMIEQAKGLCSFLEKKAVGVADLDSEEDFEEYTKEFDGEDDIFYDLISALRKAKSDLSEDNRKAYDELIDAKEQYEKDAVKAFAEFSKKLL